MTSWEPTLSTYYARIREINKITLTSGAMQRQRPQKQNQLDEWWLNIRLEHSLSDDQRQQLNSFLLTKAYPQLVRLIRETFGTHSIDLTSADNIVEATTENDMGLTYTIYQASEDLQPPTDVIFYLHGGGLIAGATKHHRNFLRYLAQALGCYWQVISIDYPLVPEHELTDSITLTQTLIKQLATASSAKNYYLVGEGSGGLLALLMNQSTSVALPPLSGRCLINAQINFDSSQYEVPVKELDLAPQDMQILTQQFQQEQLYLNLQMMFIKPQVPDLQDTQYDPLLQVATITPVPTLILAAQYDVLNATGEQYWHELQKHGWPVSYIGYQGMVNGFINNFGILPQAQLLAHDLIAWLHDLAVDAA